ncbi:hypothetical protein Tco_1244441 [Tanacetum coccineum]
MLMLKVLYTGCSWHHEVRAINTDTYFCTIFGLSLSSTCIHCIPNHTIPPLLHHSLTTPLPPPTIANYKILYLHFLISHQSFDSTTEITALEKEVDELKKDPLHTQVTTLVDEHLDTRLGETREEFMNFLSESLTARIKEQSRDEVTLAKVSSQPHSTYEAASTLTEFKLKNILIDKMEKSESYLAAPEHKIRGFKRRKTSKDAEPTIGPKNKDSKSGSSKSSKSQPKSAGKYVQSEEPEFEVADSDMPQDQEGNLVNDDAEPRKEAALEHGLVHYKLHHLKNPLILTGM